jgi:hypothetical protein
MSNKLSCKDWWATLMAFYEFLIDNINYIDSLSLVRHYNQALNMKKIANQESKLKSGQKKLVQTYIDSFIVATKIEKQKEFYPKITKKNPAEREV